MVTLEKIMHMWEEIEVWWWGFKNVDDVVYSNDLLKSFTWDNKEYTLWYSDWQLTSVSVWNKTYNINYTESWELNSIEEN